MTWEKEELFIDISEEWLNGQMVKWFFVAM